MRSQRPWIMVAGAFVVVVPSLGAMTATGSMAAVATTGFVTMTNEGTALTEGQPREWWAPGGGSITVSGTRNEVILDVSGGPSETTATLWFAAPDVEDLAVGTYPDAVNASTRPAGTPGVDIQTATGGDDAGTWGSFVVRDIAFSSSDALLRLDLSYSVHYGGAAAAVFGQVSINEPRQDQRVLVLPTTIRFPRTYAGTESKAVRVTYVNTGPSAMRIDSMKLTGLNPGQFGLWRGGCVGVRLVPDATCVARVRFTPAVGRTSAALARLVERDSAGRHAVALLGWPQPGYTSMRITGDVGEYITGGESYTFRPTNATFTGVGYPRTAYMFVTADGVTWRAQFGAVPEQLLQVGDYPNAAGGDDPPPLHPWLEVTNSDRSCSATAGSFHVYEYRLNPVTGVLEALSVTWTQYCDSETKASYGSIVYHADSPPQPLPDGG